MSKVDIFQTKMANVIRTLSEHNYNYIKLIGSGSYSTVHLVLHEHYQVEFVVKISELSDSLKDSGYSEIKNLVNLPHTNIIKIYEYFNDDDFLYLILEYCENGSLSNYVKNSGPIKPPLLYQMCTQILSALNLCHEMGMAHRDIKPGNILLDYQFRPKLADFGMSEKFQEENKAKTIIGTKAFMSPEMLVTCAKAFDPFKSDIYALGITFYFMVTGNLPWVTHSESVMIEQIRNGEIFFDDRWNPSFAKIVKMMTNFNPQSRPTAQQILQNEFFQTQCAVLIPVRAAASMVVKQPNNNNLLPQLPGRKSNDIRRDQNGHLLISLSKNKSLYKKNEYNLRMKKKIITSPMIPRASIISRK